MMDLWLEQQDEPIGACLNKFWVELDGLGLGFVVKKKRERREERERGRESERTGSDLFYIDAWTGSDQTRSNFLRSQPLDLGLRASGSIQRL